MQTVQSLPSVTPTTDIPHTVLNLGPDCSINPSDVVCDLGVLLDNTLSLKSQIASITKSCFFHLRRIRQVKKSLIENCLRTLVQALVISRLDYCNSVLYGLPASILQPLTTVLHCAAKLIKNLSPRDHVTPTIRELHWLPIPARINFKICLLMYRVYTNSSPSYFSSLVAPCSSLQSRRALRSSFQADFVVARSIKKFGNRAFALAGPAEWNKLPIFFRKSSSLPLFKTILLVIKTIILLILLLIHIAEKCPLFIPSKDEILVKVRQLLCMR